MRIEKFFPMTLVLLVLVATAATEYPHTNLSPTNPVVGDTVLLQYVLGKHPNSCVPTYETKFEINGLPILIYPPVYEIQISYTEKWPPPSSPCLQVITEYGPKYSFPDLQLGTYNVIHDGETVETFSVTREKHRIKGKVTDDPFPQKRASLPVKGAKLYVTYAPIYILRETPDLNAFAPSTMIDSTVTDENGFYSLSVPPGSYRISVSAEGYDSKNRTLSVNSDTVVNFVLLPKGASASFTGTISTVTCPGASPTSPCIVEPVPNCTVTVQKADCWSFYPKDTVVDTLKKKAIVPGSCPEYTAVTDENGEYLIKGIPVGTNGEEVTVTASCKGYKTARKKSELWNTNTTTVDFQLIPMFGNRDSVTVDGVVFTFATDRAVYENGDSIFSRYSITNNGMGEVEYGPFSGNCQYDLAITQDDDTLFHLSRNQICLRHIVYVTIPPGSTVTKDFVAWPVPSDVDGAIQISARLNRDNYDKSEVGVSALVQGSTPVSKTEGFVQTTRNTVLFDRRQSALRLTIADDQTVRMRLFSLNGSLIGEPLTSKRLSAGIHTVPIDRYVVSSGAAIVEVVGENFRKRRLITPTGSTR